MLSFEGINLWITRLIAVFALLALVELFYDRFKGKKRSFKEAGANIGVIVIGRGIGALFSIAFIFWFLELVAQFQFFSLPINGWTLGLSLLAADFSFYVAHWARHKFRLFWTIHGVHHSSTEFNLFTAIRLNGLAPVVDALFFSWSVLLLGLDPILVVSSRIIIMAYQYWLHTDKIGRLGVLDLIINTPQNHIIHHSLKPEDRDKNFGAVLMVWDHLFGTYKRPGADTIPDEFGVLVPVNSHNPLKIYLHEFVVWYRELMGKPEPSSSDEG